MSMADRVADTPMTTSCSIKDAMANEQAQRSFQLKSESEALFVPIRRRSAEKIPDQPVTCS